MKVRHKQTGVVVEVQEPAGLWWILRPASPEVHYAVPMSDYEEIKTDRWQDVTGECEHWDSRYKDGSGRTLFYDNVIIHKGNDINRQDGLYRLRKVHVVKGDWRISEPEHTEAFIVERKMSE